MSNKTPELQVGDQGAQIEEMLRRELVLVEGLIETAPVIILVLDSAARIVRFNAYMEEISGYRLQEVRDRDWIDTFLPEEDRARIRILFQEASDDIHRRGKANFIITRDGCRREIEWHEKRLKDAGGKAIGLLAVGQDITDRVQAEKVLRERSYELGERIKELNCLYGISKLVEQPEVSLQEIFQGTVDLIPPAWQYPESTCVRVMMEGRVYESNNFKETSWKQGSDILVYGQKAGVVEVCYLEKRPDMDEGPFLKEERSLIQVIAERLGTIVERSRLFEAVNKQHKQLRALAGRLAETREAERKALARELHDRVGQSLTALNLNLNIIRTQLANVSSAAAAPIQTILDDSLDLIEQTTEHVQNVMADLRPPVLDDYGLVEALRWYGAQLAGRVDFAITIQGQEPDPRLGSSVENALFRIAQEALTNVSKHARADQVRVGVETGDDMVRMSISDDGLGFDSGGQVEATKGQGWGLITMAERAEMVGGIFQIDSSPGRGTRVTVQVSR